MFDDLTDCSRGMAGESPGAVEMRTGDDRPDLKAARLLRHGRPLG
jgi:hypothetical protein